MTVLGEPFRWNIINWNPVPSSLEPDKSEREQRDLFSHCMNPGLPHRLPYLHCSLT